jgi:hypothetical protein
VRDRTVLAALAVLVVAVTYARQALQVHVGRDDDEKRYEGSTNTHVTPATGEEPAAADVLPKVGKTGTALTKKTHHPLDQSEHHSVSLSVFLSFFLSLLSFSLSLSLTHTLTHTHTHTQQQQQQQQQQQLQM